MAWYDDFLNLVPNAAGDARAQAEPALAPSRSDNGRLDATALTGIAPADLRDQLSPDAQTYANVGKLRDHLISQYAPKARSGWELVGDALKAASVPVSYYQGNQGYGAAMQRTLSDEAAARRGEADDQRKMLMENADKTVTGFGNTTLDAIQKRQALKLQTQQDISKQLARIAAMARTPEEAHAMQAQYIETMAPQLRALGPGGDRMFQDFSSAYPHPQSAPASAPAPQQAPQAPQAPVADVTGSGMAMPTSLTPGSSRASGQPSQAPTPAPADEEMDPETLYKQADKYRMLGFEDDAKRLDERAKALGQNMKYGIVSQGINGPVYGYYNEMTPGAKPVVVTGGGQGGIDEKPLSIGEKAVDKNFAQTYEEDIASGKLNDALNNINQLKEVAASLRNPKTPNVTGPYIGLVPDKLNAVINPTAIDLKNKVQSVIQRSLRPILGAQFTENEGERLIARAYNPQLEESVNADRLEKLLTATKAMADAKVKAATYFEEHGTLRGYKGSTEFSTKSLEDAIDSTDEPPPRTSVDAKLKSKYGLE